MGTMIGIGNAIGVHKGTRLNQLSTFLKGDVERHNLVALYIAKNATSEQAAKTNIANPGTYDLSGDNPMGWTKDNGWKTSTGKYLKTGIVPQNQNYAYLIVYDNYVWSQWGGWFGAQSTVPTRTVGLVDELTEGQGVSLYNGGMINVREEYDPNICGVNVINGNQYYIDGVKTVISDIPVGNGMPTVDIWLGGINKNNTLDPYQSDINILAFAIYDTVLTQSQIEEITISIKKSLNTDGYFIDIPSESQILVEDSTWETSAPHTISVVEMNSLGYRFWGYYGLQLSISAPVGLAFSNDLKNWVKYEENPLGISNRWFSVIKRNGTMYGVGQQYDDNTYLRLYTSIDGLNWTSDKILVPNEGSGVGVGNPFLYYNENDNYYYLYWVKIVESTNDHIIYGKKSLLISDLDTATPVTIIDSPGVVNAAPNLIYIDGKYFLTTEVLPLTGWRTNIYTSDNPLSGFVPFCNEYFSLNWIACLQQYKIDGKIHLFYAKSEAEWSLYHAEAYL